MTKFQPTKKVSAVKSLTTDKMLVKMSRVAYGYIQDGKIIMTTKPTASVLDAIEVFATKNNLTINA